MEPVIFAAEADRPARLVEVEALLDQLSELNPEALLLEPQDVYNLALVSITCTADDHWGRKTESWVAVYNVQACIEAVMLHLDCDADEAAEWVSYNTMGAWMGEGTPTFVGEGDDDV